MKKDRLGGRVLKATQVYSHIVATANIYPELLSHGQRLTNSQLPRPCPWGVAGVRAPAADQQWTRAPDQQATRTPGLKYTVSFVILGLFMARCPAAHCAGIVTGHAYQKQSKRRVCPALVMGGRDCTSKVGTRLCLGAAGEHGPLCLASWLVQNHNSRNKRVAKKGRVVRPVLGRPGCY